MPQGCSKKHDYPEDSGQTKSKHMTEEELDKMVVRLHSTLTESFSGTAGEQAKAMDIISKGCKSQEDVNKIIQRLSTTYTRSQMIKEGDQVRAEDIMSKGPVSERDLDTIIDRLYTTHTKSSSGGVPKQPPSASVGKSHVSQEEAKEIFERLNKTHTVSSKGSGEIRHPKEPLKPPGYGLKMYPALEGLDTRFAGFQVVPEKVDEVIARLRTTQTTASQARMDNPRILLYPERTTLMNNVERIKAYQESGAVAKQNVLQRREKWFN